MDDTLKAVGQLLIQALPTFFIVLFIYFYLTKVFFVPLNEILARRREATEGARALAAQALDRASASTAAYEEQLRAARNDIYKEQEEQRRVWRQEAEAQVSQARQSAETSVREAKAELASEAGSARAALEVQTQTLADRITAVLLQGRAL
ncbi:MAG: hypothetical protein H7039_02810, partial [Bryobacteraceae bacterium]|nr:hypothetical protein [Bryobacteraceae bacterium]